jgi:hypothetical protein
MNLLKRILFLIALALVGCNHQHSNDQDHDHDHEEVKLFITAYSDDFEIFAESDPLVMGKTSHILAHFTHITDFKPLTGGSVTISLVTGTKGIRQTTEKPSKAGIYRFQLQPETTGKSTLVFDISYQGKSYRINGGQFEVFADEHDAIHAAEDSHVEHPAIMSFTKEQSWNVNFATTPVQRKSLDAVIKSVGEVMPGRTDEITLTAQTQGVIRFLQSNLYEGTRLSAGETLLNISGEGLAENNATQRYLEA